MKPHFSRHPDHKSGRPSPIKLQPANSGDLARAFELMRSNMQPAMALNGIAWDQEWMEENYRSKDNYNIFKRGDWIGFLSVEFIKEALFIHTLQLSHEAQGTIFGVAVFNWLLGQANKHGAASIECRAFRGSPVLPLYKKLGFKVVSEHKALLKLALLLHEPQVSQHL